MGRQQRPGQCPFSVIDPGTSSANGKKCFACDGQNCNTLLNCQDNEDHCIKTTVAVGGEKVTMKGCASTSICSNPQISQVSGVIGAEVSCCQGDYCNSASSTRAGLLLVTPLIHSVLFS
uniref:urokinase plasminogen activator surface receptor-like n=1 Tax=Monopterus albus TaxID=43700 RepID=UPI0009B3DF7D|nr:urokinase plasminogen activator surface receptor-like [Monopterus albus]